MTIANSKRTDGGSIASELRPFLRDFAAFAGRKGIVAAIFVVLGALLEGLSLVLLVPLLAIMIGSGLPSGRLARMAAAVFDLFGVEQPLGQLTLLLAVFGVLIIVRAVVLYIRDMAVARLRTAFVEAHRLRIVECLAAAPWDRIVRLRHARITQLMSGDLQRIGAAASFVLQLTISVAMLLAQCVLVFLLAPILAALALGILVVGGIVFVPVVRRAHTLGGITTDTNLSLLNSIAQFLGGLKLAISQNLQTNFIVEFRQNLREQARQQIEFARQQTTSRLALSTISAFAGGLLVLVGFGAFHVAPAVLITLLLVIARMIGPAGQIQQSVQQLAHALPVYQRVKALERDLAAIRQARDEHNDMPTLPEGPIVFENVCFRHVADDEAGSMRGVRDVSLTIKSGEMVGIAGRTGAGKTTFADLLVGLYPPNEGRIAVAGMALQGATLSSWRDHVGYISQDAFLFHDTVRRNLAWAAPQANEADMWNALSLVGADELVRRMERGIEMLVGERGTLVSGGERQRLALARAILRKPRLLVLDEATSAIDVAGERDILKRLRALSPRPTIVIIAHRTESLALCNRILQFDAGRCVDDKAASRV
jgi:ATP-binding cassette subfamily C protein